MPRPVNLLFGAGAALLIYALVSPQLAQSAGFRSPEECLAYTGDAHLNCLYAYIELQQGKITALQDELSAAKVNHARVQDQVNRQASMTEELRRGLAEQDTRRPSSSVQVYPYFGPYFGYTYSFGRPAWPYNGPFHYGYRFFGPCFGSRPGYPCW